MSAWAGLWPALREFMQNTIDHLHLLGSDGRLNAALEMSHEPLPSGGGTVVRFTCGEVEVCAIRAEDDTLTIEQAFTYPMHPRALDTGVSDRTKGGEATAGGFGDGFKMAAICPCAAVAPRGDRVALRGGGRRAELASGAPRRCRHLPSLTGARGPCEHRGARHAAPRRRRSDEAASSAARPTEHRMVRLLRARHRLCQRGDARLQVFWASAAAAAAEALALLAAAGCSLRAKVAPSRGRCIAACGAGHGGGAAAGARPVRARHLVKAADRRTLMPSTAGRRST